jgi:hypothetical protein
MSGSKADFFVYQEAVGTEGLLYNYLQFLPNPKLKLLLSIECVRNNVQNNLNSMV